MFLEKLQNSQENTYARVSFLIKLQAPPATLLKKRLWRWCFPANFSKFLRTPFLQNTSGGCFWIRDTRWVKKSSFYLSQSNKPQKKHLAILMKKIRIWFWNDFWPMFPFYSPWRHQKRRFFSGVFRCYIKWEYWAVTYYTSEFIIFIS